jgi:hypothetical protein
VDLLICVASAAAVGGKLNERFAVDMAMLLIIEVWFGSIAVGCFKMAVVKLRNLLSQYSISI